MDSIRLIKKHIALFGMKDAPEWLQKVLLRGRQPLSTENVAAAGILVVALLERGKSLDEIRRMSEDEIAEVLEEGGYPDLLALGGRRCRTSA
jgi:hypothetical protein